MSDRTPGSEAWSTCQDSWASRPSMNSAARAGCSAAQNSFRPAVSWSASISRSSGRYRVLIIARGEG